MSKFIELYNKIIAESRGFLTPSDLSVYPPHAVEAYNKFSNLRKNYYSAKYKKIREYDNNIPFSGTEKNVIFNNLINAIANSFIKMAKSEESENQVLSKDAEKQLKQQLIEYYKDKSITIEDWKKLAEILRAIKNDPDVKSLHNELTIAYQALPKTMKNLIDMPDKSNVTVVDEILNQRLALQNYYGEDEITNDPDAMISMAESFEKRSLDEENAYSVLTRANGKPFVIKYVTSTNKEIVRAGKLNVMAYDDATYVKDPLEASRRLSSYNNITYYDFTSKVGGYRTAKLSNTISISIGNFDSGIGITYMLKH